MIWIVRKPYAPGFIIGYTLIEIGLLLKILYFYIQISRNNFFRWLSISLYDGLGYRYVYIFYDSTIKSLKLGQGLFVDLPIRAAYTVSEVKNIFRIELYCKNKIF